jgi:hypothetical protein
VLEDAVEAAVLVETPVLSRMPSSSYSFTSDTPRLAVYSTLTWGSSTSW